MFETALPISCTYVRDKSTITTNYQNFMNHQHLRSWSLYIYIFDSPQRFASKRSEKFLLLWRKKTFLIRLSTPIIKPPSMERICIGICYSAAYSYLCDNSNQRFTRLVGNKWKKFRLTVLSW